MSKSRKGSHDSQLRDQRLVDFVFLELYICYCKARALCSA